MDESLPTEADYRRWCGSQEWSSYQRDGELTVCFSKTSAGWILMTLMSTAALENHVVYCSDLYDPFPDLVDWLNYITESRYPDSVTIDEEGIDTRLSVFPHDPSRIVLWVERPPVDDDPRPIPEQNTIRYGDRLILCRVDKCLFIAEWYRRLKDFMSHDFSREHWSAHDWSEYVNDQEPYRRWMDLRRLDLSRLS